jgi:UDP-N-acetylmuramyl tripeptide synthase
MRKIIAVTITKLFIIIGKLVGKKGSSTPGKFALFIYPGILKYLASQIRGKIIVVCGTNGKTTTNNMLCSLLESEGKKVVCNHVGANMLEGVVTAFAGSTNFLGRLDADYACIEIDEISAASVFEHFLPDYMIITNLFRDQLDRYGEIDITIRHLSKAVSKAENAVLVLNADDPLVAALGKNAKNKCVYYGIGEDAGISLSETKEGRFCSFCHSELVYSFYHYSQLGSYGCVKCGFSRPKPQYEALDVNLTDEMSFTVDGKRISVNYRGFYNIYNILAAYAAVRLCGFSLDNINDVLGAYKPQIGRMEAFNICGKNVIFNLSKNPAGFNQAISAVVQDKRKKDIVVVINDNAQDGKDISWIWDVDFERLADAGISGFTASGIRHNDVFLRFKYARLESIKDIGDVRLAITDALKSSSQVLYVLVNYTALFPTQKILQSLEEKL